MLLMYSCKKESEIVVFQDYQFLSTLIKEGIDTDGDGSISFTEASQVKTMNINNNRISDLQGIESFVNLEKLECRQNQLTNLDLSANTSLKSLDCSYNVITKLELSKILICRS